jgi:hypothetical protein
MGVFPPASPHSVHLGFMLTGVGPRQELIDVEVPTIGTKNSTCDQFHIHFTTRLLDFKEGKVVPPSASRSMMNASHLERTNGISKFAG